MSVEMLFASQHRTELSEKGYTVVNGVLSEAECDRYRKQYVDWIDHNFDHGTFPITRRSLVRASYKMGHIEPSWAIRLKCKPVFTQLWNTDELLTSFDSVCIGRPPEEGSEAFRSDATRWLHIDQLAEDGLHVYQGAVYLEHAAHDDWTFEVLDGSHKLFGDFWREHPDERARSVKESEGSSKFTPQLTRWFTDKGCQSHHVTVPKGGLVLWDSMTVHANANPVQGRQNPGRWRWSLIVSMWPVSLASPEIIQSRQEAYHNMAQTCHDGRVKAMEEPLEVTPKHPLTELPEIARSLQAKRLAGVEAY